MVIGIDVIFLHVKDPQRMANWYKDILGFEIGFRTSDLHWQEFALPMERPPTRFGLDKPDSLTMGPAKQRIMISFGVANLSEFVKDKEEHGLEFYGEPKIMDVGPTLVATTRDPEGNWIQFSQRK